MYIATSKELEDYDNFHFINGNICTIIEEERKKERRKGYISIWWRSTCRQFS
ncbi:hypothetical protein CNEO4_80165 [Clostridium neonatale]|nr:hypothetical protein CNEO4_80165 [Clostridium neonatale]